MHNSCSLKCLNKLRARQQDPCARAHQTEPHAIKLLVAYTVR